MSRVCRSIAVLALAGGALGAADTMARVAPPARTSKASVPPCRDGSRPWTRFNTEYAVPFAPPQFIPTCRLMAHGTRDEKPAALKNDHIGAPLPFTVIARNPAARGKKRRWPLVDSYGTPIAEFEVTKSGGVKLFAGPRRTLSRRDRLYVQGKGCMSPHSLQSSYAIVKVGKAGVRAFLPRAAFGSRAGSIPFDSNSTRCGKPGNAPGPDPEAPAPYPFDFTAAYAGNAKVLKTNGKIGTGYVSYSLRTFAATGPTVEAVSVSSLGTSGGGVYRALIEGTDTFRQLDHFGYVDPAVPCGQPKIARWVFGEVIHGGQPTGIYGYVPRPAQPAKDKTGTYCP